MEASPTPSIPSARPYRSHKLRACDYCRKRKARCSVEKLGQACLLCRSNGFNCAYSDTQNTTGGQSEISAIGDGERASPVRPLKRTHAAIEESGPNSHVSISQHQTSRTQDASRIQHRTARGTPEQSAHIVGPAISSDAHVLEQYMTPNSPEGHQSTQNPYSVYSTDPHKPVLYRKVPRRRPGLEETREPGVKQKAILDQILAPNTQGLLQLYFEKVHPAFPVVDETKFVESSTNEPPHPSAALTCAIYSITLSYWSQFKFSKNHIRPDAKFAWNLAVKAIQDEFLGPGFSTLQAVLVDLTGRPTFSITGNVINNGKAVTLSHSLGLNRDPSSWNISQHEKSLRVRLWWGVLIHDRWGSFAHGTPPLINSAQYDVPIPTLDGAMISPRVSKAHEMTLECFVALCKLTEILGRVLPLIYDLKGNSQKEILKVIRRVETDIDEWEDALPDYLQKNQEVKMSVSGSSSLYLGLLSLKMLVCRISLHAVGQMDDSSSSETLQYRQFECRKAAQNIVDFVQCLDSSHLGEFWLPYGAYYLTSTTTLLLRFAVETTDDSVAESCVSSVKTLTQRLRQAKDHDDWDLADDSLSQCDGILARITHNARPLRELPVGSFPALEVDAPPGDWLDATLPAFYGPMDGSGQMRDVWNMFDFEPFNI